MTILDRLFPLSSGGADESTCGNVIVSGSGEAGADQVYYQILEETLAAQRLLILFDGKQTAAEWNIVEKLLISTMKDGRLGYLLNENEASSDAVDPLSAFSDNHQKAGFLAQLLIQCGINPYERERLVRYYYLLLEYYTHKSVKPQVKEILGIDPDTALSKIESDPAFSPADKRDADILMKGMRSLYETSMAAAAGSYRWGGLSRLLNGSVPMNKVLHPGNALVVCAPASGYDETVRVRPLHIFAGLISMCIQRFDVPVTIVFRHCDFLPETVFKDILLLNSRYRSLSVWFPDDISGFVNTNGPEVMDLIRCRAVFRTENINTADFWEKQAGQRERTDTNTTVTTNNPGCLFGGIAGWGHFLNMGGFAPGLPRNSSVSVGTGKKMKPNCPAAFERCGMGK